MAKSAKDRAIAEKLKKSFSSSDGVFQGDTIEVYLKSRLLEYIKREELLRITIGGLINGQELILIDVRSDGIVVLDDNDQETYLKFDALNGLTMPKEDGKW